MNAVVVALAGGVLIGLSAVLLMLANGRIAGISGIVGGLFGGGSGEISWRLAFLVGLIAGPFVAMLCGAPLPHDPDRCPRSRRYSFPACWSASVRGWATGVPAATGSVAYMLRLGDARGICPRTAIPGPSSGRGTCDVRRSGAP
jgi:uncharacterized membrane protein YedE/YeeE